MYSILSCPVHSFYSATCSFVFYCANTAHYSAFLYLTLFYFALPLRIPAFKTSELRYFRLSCVSSTPLQSTLASSVSLLYSILLLSALLRSSLVFFTLVYSTLPHFAPNYFTILCVVVFRALTTSIFQHRLTAFKTAELLLYFRLGTLYSTLLHSPPGRAILLSLSYSSLPNFAVPHTTLFLYSTLRYSTLLYSAFLCPFYFTLLFILLHSVYFTQLYSAHSPLVPVCARRYERL